MEDTAPAARGHGDAPSGEGQSYQRPAELGQQLFHEAWQWQLSGGAKWSHQKNSKKIGCSGWWLFQDLNFAIILNDLG